MGCRGEGPLSLPAVALGLENCSSPSIDVDAQVVKLFVRATASEARCPLCNHPCERVHSRYLRKLADLPWHGREVRMQVEVRRFYCPVPQCPRRIFAERLPFAAAFARTTSRLRSVHTDIGLFLGGEAGARLAQRLAMTTSPDTLLRRIRQIPEPAVPHVRVLGVDDWSFRRGQRYGTIVCDLERHRAVELLPERSADALSQWLRAHPEVEIISRDRADDYIKGASAGAPQALQVADRWHLLRNLRDALRRLVERLPSKVRDMVGSRHPATEVSDTVARTEDVPDERRQTRYAQRQRDRRQRRYDRYQQVKDLHEQGVAQREIARRLGINRATVRRFVRAASFPERACRRTSRRTDEVVHFLRQRWSEGCRNAAQLFKELRPRGFQGSYYMVRRRLARWRRQGSVAAQSKSSNRSRLSPRRAAWLLLKPESELNDAERAWRADLAQRDAVLSQAASQGRQFREMIRQHQGKELTRWLDQSQRETVPEELRSFAKGLQEDEAAVRAALDSPWSNGQVEGQVNRLKTVKRQMYGRAKFDLLRRRFLLAA
jgi:transposase